MHKNILETIMGAVVLLVAAGFLIFAYRSSDMGMGTNNYRISAAFGSAAGIALGSDVRVGGVKVGTVDSLKLNPETYQAVATLAIHKDTPLPKDSTAAIVGNGLLGEKYVQVTPGGDDQMLAEGGKISYTQSSVNLEELIGKFMFSGGGVDKKDAKPTASVE